MAKRSFAISFQNNTPVDLAPVNLDLVSPVKVDSPLPFPWTQRGEIYTPAWWFITPPSRTSLQI